MKNMWEFQVLVSFKKIRNQFHFIFITSWSHNFKIVLYTNTESSSQDVKSDQNDWQYKWRYTVRLQTNNCIYILSYNQEIIWAMTEKKES